MTKPSNHANDAIMGLPCLCALIRKADRVVTKRFDGHMKGSGLRITQYSMLMNIRFNPEVTISQLSDLLRMDQTTVTRNIKVLEKMNTIAIEQDSTDHRVRRITITEHGRSVLRASRSSWEAAQGSVSQALGKEQTNALVDALQRLTSL